MTVIDQNKIQTIQAALNTDGSTLTNVTADPSIRNSLKIDDDTTGTDQSTNVNALRNQNYKTGLWALSSADGVTLVQLYCDSDGKLLINSN